MKRATMYAITLTVLFACSKGGGNTPLQSASTPTVTTATSTATATAATSGGMIGSDGGAMISVRGVCWSTSQNPTIADSKTTDGNGTGSYVSTITGLTPYTTYFIRAYATNSIGTGYGQQVTITTTQDVPTVTTAPITVVNSLTFQGGGQILGTGQSTIKEAGICWDTIATPTIAKNKLISVGSGLAGSIIAVTFPYSQLTSKLTYHVRAYATNTIGTGYGAEVTFTPNFAVGLQYGGGIIFYLDNTANHGLVVSTIDIANSVPWAVANYGQTGATSTTDGATNTTKIISYVGNNGTYAAKLCRDYRAGGFTDWYLPSANELFQLRVNRDVVGGFTFPPSSFSQYYWSSSESSSSPGNAGAYAHNFFGTDLTGTLSNQSKAASLPVRAIRSF